MELELVKKLLQEKPRARELAKAVKHQERLRFHTETEIVKSDLSPYHTEFIAWICTEKPELLPKDKVERFKQLLTCPLSTIQLTEAIRIAWSRVFEGENAFYRYDFDDPKLEADWEQFRDDEFWKTDGFEAMMTAIDSVWVVDLPAEQSGDRPEPRNMLIDISNVLDLSVNRSGECNHVIFSIGEKLFVYDNEVIQVYEFKDKVVKNLISEFRHELGYCPARTFWTSLLNSKNYINHKSPLTNVLAELDWLLAHRTFKKWMDLGNSYPILVTLKLTDDSNGFIREDNKGRAEGDQKTLGGDFVGPGSILQVPVPQEGQPDLMANPVKWIAPDVTSLEFHVKEDVRLTDYIYKTSVGIDGEQNNDQAKNEKQVLASFENQSIILKRIAMNFEKVQSFADRVIISLRYGQDVNVSIDYGNKFFLKTAEDLMAETENAKGDDVLADSIYSELIETKYRNDSGGKLRAYVLRDLNPLPYKTIEETISLKNAGGITDEAFKIKSNFMNYVMRFEREQLPIDQFMKSGDYNTKVEKILDEFKKYASEEAKEKPADVNAGDNNDNDDREKTDSGQFEPGSNDQ